MTKAGRILETAIIFYLQSGFVLFLHFLSLKSNTPKKTSVPSHPDNIKYNLEICALMIKI